MRTHSLGRSNSLGLASRRQSTSRSYRRPSFKRTNTDDTGSSNEEGLRHPGDVKVKQVFKGTQLLFLAYQSIGVIYGDIGTSPLYVFSGTFSSAPAR